MYLESQWGSLGVSSTRAPARGGGKSLGMRNSWPSLGEILFWCQSPSSVTLCGWVLSAIATAFTTQAEELVVETKRLCDEHHCIAQETEDAEIKRDKMFNWVHDLMDQRYDVKADIWRLEQGLNSKNRSWHSLRPEKKSWEVSGLHLTPVVTSSVSGLSKGASAEPEAPKKKKRGKQKPKRHPGLPSQEGQEYYKSYLPHL